MPTVKPCARGQLLLIMSCVSWMNQGRFNFAPDPDWMVKR